MSTSGISYLIYCNAEKILHQLQLFLLNRGILILRFIT